MGPQDLGQLLRCVQSQQVSALKLLLQLTYIRKKDSTAIQDYGSQFQKVANVSGLVMITSPSRALREVSPTYNWQARPREQLNAHSLTHSLDADSRAKSDL